MNKQDNGLYVFVLEGNIKIGDQDLGKRDGMGIWNTSEVDMKINKDSRLLLMEVPMNI